MIVIHHLGVSQSERIPWVCEELGVEYEIAHYKRDPVESPESLKAVPGNALGRSPFIEDTTAGVTLAESGAIVDYLNWRYGQGKLALKPDDPNFPQYLYWFHYANATLHSSANASIFVAFKPGTDTQADQFATKRVHDAIRNMDNRLKDNKWLAGSEFTAADCMSVYPLTTQRYFSPTNLGPYPNVLRWLKDCSERPAYKRGMEKGDPDLQILIGAEPPEKSLFAVGGVTSDIWKKAHLKK